MKFIITVDTEADNQWKNSDVKLENIKFLSRFNSLCFKYVFPATYLITYEVADNEQSVEILKSFVKETGAEIGAHLHPWTNPPFLDEHKGFQAFPSELDDKNFQDKLRTLTFKIEEKFSIKPTSFRAGRWGFDSRMIKYLLKLNYLVDCSITPKINWKHYQGLAGGPGGPDYRLSSLRPHYLLADDITTPGVDGLMEVPMTIIYAKKFFKEDGAPAKNFSSWPDSKIKKIINKIFFKQNWLRIFPETKIKDLISVYESAVYNGLPEVEFMIHSSELMPGGSPYAKTEKQVEKIYDIFEKFLEYLKKEKVDGITLSNFAKVYLKNGINKVVN